MSSSSPVARLVDALEKLPGIGRKSAERMAMKIARDDKGLASEMIDALTDVRSNIRTCSQCGSITSIANDPCRLCTSSTRDDTILCVVEDAMDIINIERSGEFKGRYFLLMGRITAGRNPIKPERLKQLSERISGGKTKEVILALGTDTESDATASYLEDMLKSAGLTMTRLAMGLPIGSSVAYSDPVTLARAIKGRTRAN